MLSTEYLSCHLKDIEKSESVALNLQIYHLSGHEFTLIDRGCLSIATLARIEKMMKQIQMINEPPFEERVSVQGQVQLKTNILGKLFNTLSRLPAKQALSHTLPKKAFSPTVELLLTMLDGQEWRYVSPSYVMFDGRMAAYHFNDFIERMRIAVRQPKFQKKVAYWCGLASKNHQGAVKYLCRLLDKYKRLRVVRLDLTYQLNSPERHDEVLCKKHFKRFTENQRNNQLFKNVVGFIWRLEYGKEMGFHFHWILLFDGDHVWKEEWYADQIGNYWKETITAGQGAFHNCNRAARINGHRNSAGYGLGELKLNDRQKLDTVCKNVIGYLTKVDALIQSKGVNGKTFGRGVML
ncbi:inovirus-type Gp2 protein [Chitinibacter fontanus]|uniref:Inovirus-type Gp2 protein n=1 Tax=Chitinibacter fontanus TaxID=1737446 RepID=A0A7D5V7J9_9NEIS|nr:inovirus-type Gp2 protein [Chitinibacter fontanus]QLI80256.1 inovirus-type Gp2 protein [Chitinibacter fontanus]